ncbi:MAG: response regulator transcription factor [Ilumatobacteraceae bacterium]
MLNDYRIVVDGLAKMLAPFDDVDVVELDIRTVAVDRDVDVALFDTYGRVGMPWQQLEDLVSLPNVRHTTVFTFDFGTVLVDRAMDIGVHGYLWKGLTPAALAESLRRVAGGEIVVSTPENQARQPDRSYRWPFDDLGLSARESEVLALLSEGLSNQQIADGVYLNVETVRSHLKQIYSKLGVHTRTQATAKALRGQAFLHR